MDEASDAQSAPDELGRAQALIAAQDFAAAEQVLAPFVAANPQNGAAQYLYCRCLVQQRKYAEALRACEAAVVAIPGNARLRILHAQSLIALNRAADAQAALKDAADSFPGDAPIAALLAELLMRAGDYPGALAAAGRAVSLEPTSPIHAATNIVLHCVAGEGEIPADLVERADRERVATLARRITLQLRQQKRGEMQRVLIPRILALVPDAIVLRILYADALLGENNPQEALTVLESGAAAIETTPPDIAIRFHKLRARVRRALKGMSGSQADLERVLSLDAEDKDALEALYKLHRHAGRHEEMRQVAARLARANAPQMPRTLAEGLEALSGSSAKVDLGSEKVAWAWSLADTTAWQRERWLADIAWGRRADLLLRAWWLNLFERGDEIAALIDPPSPGLDDLLAPGERGLVVTSHLGPMAGFVYFMQTCGRPFRGFGFSGPDPVVGEAAPMRIASNTADRAGALRELVDEIRKGTLVGFAPDSPTGKDVLTFDFLGRPVELSPLVPRLAQRHRAATVYCQPLWRGQRIVLEMRRLPDPKDAESPDDFSRRWCLAYLAGLEATMRGDPRNLNLASGIWVNARARPSQ
ncbi:MAG: tetratricopeptide repeat protein [Alphaproteobacteria bacterium]|nr:tetratricopeptide repeat protein [Alphaproteobacteria bacterium]MBV9695105.1 tetratricopeptide repeat protein [Alphaproteobacteria bacterium]